VAKSDDRESRRLPSSEHVRMRRLSNDHFTSLIDFGWHRRVRISARSGVGERTERQPFDVLIAIREPSGEKRTQVTRPDGGRNSPICVHIVVRTFSVKPIGRD
jgi:hypothetical protein